MPTQPSWLQGLPSHCETGKIAFNSSESGLKLKNLYKKPSDPQSTLFRLGGVQVLIDLPVILELKLRLGDQVTIQLRFDRLHEACLGGYMHGVGQSFWPMRNELLVLKLKWLVRIPHLCEKFNNMKNGM
jgi:hypothetical protein